MNKWMLILRSPRAFLAFDTSAMCPGGWVFVKWNGVSLPKKKRYLNGLDPNH